MLTTYHKKRDFKITPEPAGAARPKSKSALSYVIQKHAASHLHYDFRLELDGTLKSWAVPKGPSLDPARKSLAIQVEDHPIEYGDFEGTIPKGQYGGGSVLLWDRGTWEPLDDPRKGLKDGKLRFILHGEKLKGQWTLVRFHGPQKSDKPQWLLMKSSDEYAKPGGNILEDAPRSVKSDNDITSIGANGKQWNSSAEPAAAEVTVDPMPADIRPQLATWSDHPPSGDQWLHEVKFDGYRLICRIHGGDVHLITRGGEDWTHRFPRVARELSKIPGDAILDGEVVVVDKEGRSHFQLLQNARKDGQTADPLIYVFDLLHRDGKDLRSEPLVKRKEQLKKILDKLKAPRVKYSDHVKGDGNTVVDAACKMHLEGIISKDAAAPYRSGRTMTWLKSKCGYRQEFIIVGYTDPRGTRAEFGALLLAYHDENGKLVYAGKVGTGFDADLLRQVKKQMTTHARPTPPTDLPPPAPARRGAHWIAPNLVAEIKFAGWTGDKMIRQGTFLGLRKDKPAAQVVREDKAAPKLAHRRVKPVAPQAEAAAGTELTHPDRILFPGTKITKADLAAYYDKVAERMLPHVVDRPLTLLRCPAGQGGQCFIQRHFTDKLPPAILSINTAAKGAPELHMMIQGADGLRALVQINALEIHAWGSFRKEIEKPDRLVFDLDPDTELPWAKIVAAAQQLRDTLTSVKLKPLVKTTGGKGLHIVVPIEPTVDWDRAKEFCKSIALEMVRRDPKFYTANMSKAQRPGRVFIDYLRNGRSATSVVAYSSRARAGAPVSVPVEWDELPRLKAANRFTVQNIDQRLKRPDPWADFESQRVDLLQAVGISTEKSISQEKS